MYFIPWVLLLVGVILSVPIASWLEKRKLKAAYGPADDPLADESEMGEDAEGEVVEDAGLPEPPGENEAEFGADGGFGGEGDFGGGDDFGGEEFSEFEEIK